MQDRYAGDVGDFLNFALLRWLIEPTPLRLGVVWYLVADEAHNGDGRHVSYLDRASPLGRRLRPLDPDLHDRLAAVVAGRRSVPAIETSGALPTGTTTFGDLLDLRSAEHRAAWAGRAAAAMADRDVVFVDPDNGIRRSDHAVPRHRAKAGKHAYLDELQPFADRGQSIVAYHHADRSATVEEQAQRRLAEAGDALGVEPLAAVRASRGSSRLFLVLPAEAHAALLAARVEALESSPWAGELRAYWWRGLDGAAPGT